MEFNATFIVSLISFVIFVCVMNWILYRPIDDIVEKRKNFIDENYKEAENNLEKSKTILKERLDKIESTRKVAMQNYLDAINKAKSEKENAILVANKKFQNEIIEKENEYNEETKQANDTLKNDVVEIAKMISKKFINVQENEEIQPELINKIIQG